MAYDIPITGFNTFNTNNLRLWRSKPYFGEGDQQEEDETEEDLVDRIDKIQDAEYLTSIYYPNLPEQAHKEERLKQEYFYAASTLQDLMRRFKKDIMYQMNEFYEKN
jgi:starch phosphorylase